MFGLKAWLNFFSSFTANNWFGLWEEAFVRGSSIVMPDKVTPMGKVHPLVIAGMERLTVITVEVINPAITAFEIVAKPFYLFNYFFSSINFV